MRKLLLFILLVFQLSLQLAHAKKIGVFHVTKGSKYQGFSTVVNHREDMDFANQLTAFEVDIDLVSSTLKDAKSFCFPAQPELKLSQISSSRLFVNERTVAWAADQAGYSFFILTHELNLHKFMTVSNLPFGDKREDEKMKGADEDMKNFYENGEMPSGVVFSGTLSLTEYFDSDTLTKYNTDMVF